MWKCLVKSCFTIKLRLLFFTLLSLTKSKNFETFWNFLKHESVSDSSNQTRINRWHKCDVVKITHQKSTKIFVWIIETKGFLVFWGIKSDNIGRIWVKVNKHNYLKNHKLSNKTTVVAQQRLQRGFLRSLRHSVRQKCEKIFICKRDRL